MAATMPAPLETLACAADSPSSMSDLMAYPVASTPSAPSPRETPLGTLKFREDSACVKRHAGFPVTR